MQVSRAAAAWLSMARCLPFKGAAHRRDLGRRLAPPLAVLCIGIVWVEGTRLLWVLLRARLRSRAPRLRPAPAGSWEVSGAAAGQAGAITQVQPGIAHGKEASIDIHQVSQPGGELPSTQELAGCSGPRPGPTLTCPTLVRRAAPWPDPTCADTRPPQHAPPATPSRMRHGPSDCAPAM